MPLRAGRPEKPRPQAAGRRPRTAPGIPRARALGVLVLGLALAGAPACGSYRLVRSEPAEGGRIAIRTLRNDTAHAGLELLVSESLRRTVLERGVLTLVADPDDADWVVAGTVQPLAVRSQSFSSVVLALEYTLTLSLELRVDGPDGPLRLDRELLQGTDLYLASADVEVTRRNRREALRRAASSIASRVHDVLAAEGPP